MTDKVQDGDRDRTTGITGGFRRLVGYRLKTWAEGYGEMELVIGPEHDNSHGMVHGGLYATLLDAAMGHAVAWCAVPGNIRRATTLSLTVNYLQGAKSGTLVATAKLEAVEGRVATVTGEVRTSDGLLCATGLASFMYFPGSEGVEGVPRA
jgi:uncharacterized protein (TIGR00369 family)